MSESQKPRFRPNPLTPDEVERAKLQDRGKKSRRSADMDLLIDEEGKKRSGPSPLPKPEGPKQLAPDHSYVLWMTAIFVGSIVALPMAMILIAYMLTPQPEREPEPEPVAVEKPPVRPEVHAVAFAPIKKVVIVPPPLEEPVEVPPVKKKVPSVREEMGIYYFKDELRPKAGERLTLPEGQPVKPYPRADHDHSLPYHQQRWWKLGAKRQQIVTQGAYKWYDLGAVMVMRDLPEQEPRKDLTGYYPRKGEIWQLIAVCADCGVQVTGLPGATFIAQEGEPMVAVRGEEAFEPNNPKPYRVLIRLRPGSTDLQPDMSQKLLLRGEPSKQELESNNLAREDQEREKRTKR